MCLAAEEGTGGGEDAWSNGLIHGNDALGDCGLSPRHAPQRLASANIGGRPHSEWQKLAAVWHALTKVPSPVRL